MATTREGTKQTMCRECAGCVLSPKPIPSLALPLTYVRRCHSTSEWQKSSRSPLLYVHLSQRPISLTACVAFSSLRLCVCIVCSCSRSRAHLRPSIPLTLCRRPLRSLYRRPLAVLIFMTPLNDYTLTSESNVSCSGNTWGGAQVDALESPHALK